MRDFSVEFTPLSDADFDAIQDYIALDNPRRALTFVEELRDACIRFLAVTPLAGTQVGRFRYYSRGRYVVVYEVEEARRNVRVLMVTEGHRDWRRIFDV